MKPARQTPHVIRMTLRLPSPPSNPPDRGAIERAIGRLAGWLLWALLAAAGVVFLISLLIWMFVMAVISLVSSLITGRPAAVTLLWRRYREMARQSWPRPPSTSNTARPTSHDDAPAKAADTVEDVHWRDLPPSRDPPRE